MSICDYVPGGGEARVPKLPNAFSGLVSPSGTQTTERRVPKLQRSDATSTITVGAANYDLAIMTNKMIADLLARSDGQLSPDDRTRAEGFMKERAVALDCSYFDLQSNNAYLDYRNRSLELILTDDYKPERQVICQIIGAEAWKMYVSYCNGTDYIKLATEFLDLTTDPHHDKVEMCCNLLDLAFMATLHITGMRIKQAGLMSQVGYYPLPPNNVWAEKEFGSRTRNLKNPLAALRYDAHGFESTHKQPNPLSVTYKRREAKKEGLDSSIDDDDVGLAPNADLPEVPGDFIDDTLAEPDGDEDDFESSPTPTEDDEAREATPSVTQLGFETVPELFKAAFLEVLKNTEPGESKEEPLKIHRGKLSEAVRSVLAELSVVGLVIVQRGPTSGYDMWYVLNPRYEDLLAPAKSGALDKLTSPTTEGRTLEPQVHNIEELQELISRVPRALLPDLMECLSNTGATGKISKRGVDPATFERLSTLQSFGVLGFTPSSGQYCFRSPYNWLIGPFKAGQLDGMLEPTPPDVGKDDTPEGGVAPTPTGEETPTPSEEPPLPAPPSAALTTDTAAKDEPADAEPRGMIPCTSSEQCGGKTFYLSRDDMMCLLDANVEFTAAGQLRLTVLMSMIADRNPDLERKFLSIGVVRRLKGSYVTEFTTDRGLTV